MRFCEPVPREDETILFGGGRPRRHSEGMFRVARLYVSAGRY
jgi:hypothetical protein